MTELDPFLHPIPKRTYNMAYGLEIPEFLRRPLPPPSPGEGNPDATVTVTTVATPDMGPQTECDTPAAVPTIPDPRIGQPGYVAHTHGMLTEGDKRAMAEIEAATYNVAVEAKRDASAERRTKKQEEKAKRAEIIKTNRQDFYKNFKWSF